MFKSHVIRAVLISLVLKVIQDFSCDRVLTETFETAEQHSLWTNFSLTIDEITEKNANTSTRRALLKTETVIRPHNRTYPMQFLLDNDTDELTQIFLAKGQYNAASTNGSSAETDLAVGPVAAPLNTSSTVSSKQGTTDDEKDSFLPPWFRKYAILLACTLPLQYYWQIWLDRLFPGRGRRRAQQKNRGDHGDHGASPREEEIVKRWIYEGRVRSASLSWCNTFLKWSLDAFIGRALFAVVEAVAEKMLCGQFRAATTGSVYADMLWAIGANFVTMRALDQMIALVIVPAHQRLVFLAATDLGWRLLFVLVLRNVVPWLMHNPFIEEVFRNMTDEAAKGKNPAFQIEEL